MVSRERQDRLVDLLTRTDGWRTAGDLAGRLGVTGRSVRSYVAAINSRIADGDVIESGPHGYRVRAEHRTALRDAGDAVGPMVRRRAIARTLALSPAGVDVYDLAGEHFVSEGTIEADLAWVRARAHERGLRWERHSAIVALAGTEEARRTFIRFLLSEDSGTGIDERAVDEMLGAGAAAAARRIGVELSHRLTAAGFFVNEFALAGAAVAVVLAARRSAAGFPIEPAAATAFADSVEPLIADVTEAVVQVPLDGGERRALAALLGARGAIASSEPSADTSEDGAVSEVLRTVLSEVTTRFGVPEIAPDVFDRLVAHVQNLRRRSTRGEWSKNPLTRTLKARYPLLFDVAVAVATGLDERLDIPVHDDEVAYIAMHIGGQWERARSIENRMTAALVCHGYYEMHESLRLAIEQALGSVLEVTTVVTGMDASTAGLDTDLVLTTIERAGENVVQISPFFTDLDTERVMAAVARIRRSRRLAQLREDVGRYFEPDAFIHGIDALGDEEAVIRALAAPLQAAGVIDEEYVESAVRRERASSTAFTETLAVPHAIGMTATRTAISVGIAESAVAWGEARVQVVALVAFSASDREAFQTVFEQFIEVFADPSVVQRIVRKSPDLASFVECVVAVIDD